MATMQDPGPTTGQLIAALLGAIPILAIMAWAAVRILGPIGQAFARRIAGGAESEVIEQRVETLALELDSLKLQLAEAQERLDFTERLLSQSRVPQLPKE
ncbi:MAG TPA: hypothetical protein VH879_07955 [Gemmatimonadales bacterium]